VIVVAFNFSENASLPSSWTSSFPMQRKAFSHAYLWNTN
jgi:hypothetical protein